MIEELKIFYVHFMLESDRLGITLYKYEEYYDQNS